MITVEQARKVKNALAEKFETDLNFAGIGISGNKDEGYGVKINFHQEPIFNKPPEIVNGVKITVCIVGNITKK